MMELDPEVKSQLDVLTKAREGLKAAKAMVEQAEAIIKLFPDDKTAIRAKTEADRMVERFQKHEEAAHKIIRTLSKKSLPPALKKEADIATKAIKARLVDPEALEVIPWQSKSILRNGGVEYQMVFRLKGVPKERYFSDWRLTEATGDATAKVESWENGRLNTSGVSGKGFAANLLEALRGWSGIKGEAEATAGRADTAKAIARAIDQATRGHYDNEAATISKDNITIEGAYRSDLPKEGAGSVGEYEYDEMVKREIASCRKSLDPKLAPYKDQIARVEIHDGEKSWIYINVTLK